MDANFPLPNCGRNDLNDATEYIIGPSHEKGSSIFKTRPGLLSGCSTGGCSTIQIEQKLFDDLKSWDVRLKLCLTEN